MPFLKFTSDARCDLRLSSVTIIYRVPVYCKGVSVCITPKDMLVHMFERCEERSKDKHGGGAGEGITRGRKGK